MLAIGFLDTIGIWIEQVSSFLPVSEKELNGYSIGFLEKWQVMGETGSL